MVTYHISYETFIIIGIGITSCLSHSCSANSQDVCVLYKDTALERLLSKEVQYVKCSDKFIDKHHHQNYQNNHHRKNSAINTTVNMFTDLVALTIFLETSICVLWGFSFIVICCLKNLFICCKKAL